MQVHGSDHEPSSEHIVVTTFVCESVIALCSLQPCASVYNITSYSMHVKDASHYESYMFYAITPRDPFTWRINLSTSSQATVYFHRLYLALDSQTGFNFKML